MRYQYYLLLSLTILFLLASCGSASKMITTLKPEADLAAPLIYEKEISSLNIPITIKLKDVAYQANKNLVGLIYEDNQLEDDNVALKVWKESPILIQEEMGKIKIVLPLKVWAKVRYGAQVFGVNMYDTRELNFRGVVTLVSDVKLLNWQLQTKTSIQSIDWKESPSVSIAGKVMPISYLVNPALNYFRATLEKNMDEAIKKSLNFQPYVLDALEQLSIPKLVNEQYETWFRIAPLSLTISEASIKNEAILLELGLDCYMETIIENEVPKSFQRDQIRFKQTSKIAEQFTASLMVVSPYLQISEVITSNFKGQEFTSGDKKVMVTNVDLWHKNNKLIVALDLAGSLNGTVYLSGIPAYNEETAEIYFEELDYILDTKNALMKTANWIAQGIILKKIKENAKYSLKEGIEEAQKQMTTYLNNYSPAKGVFINGKVDGIRLTKIQLTNQAIIATIKSTGKIKVTIDGLK